MADEPEHTGGMVALIPADSDQLAVDGGEPTGDLHLTLAYLGDDVTTWTDEQRNDVMNAARALADRLGPVEARVFAHAIFNPDGHDDREPCAVYLIGDTDQLRPARDELAGVAAGEQHEPFVPHITAGYGLDVADLSYVGPVLFDRLRIALADDSTDLPLGEREAVMAAATANDTAEPALVVEDTGDVLKVLFPVLAIEGMDTGDGRYITPGGLGCRALPLSLAAQPYDPHGGQDSPAAEVFGKITATERHPGSEVTSPTTGEPFGAGVFVWSGEGEIDGAHRWADLVRKGYLRGVSIVMGEMDAEIIAEDEAALSENPRRRAIVNGANIACATLVPVPAFADAHLELADDTAMVAAAQLPSELHTEPVPPWLSPDLGDEVAAMRGLAVPMSEPEPTEIDDAQRDAITAAACAMVEKFGPTAAYAHAPLVFPTPKHLTVADSVIELPLDADDVVVAAATSDLPPIEWFEPPVDLPPGTGHYVDGRRVYGRLAEWNVPHIGSNGRKIYPPRSVSGYRWFHTKATRAQGPNGTERIKIGHLTFGVGHAPTDPGVDHLAAAAHYDHSGCRGAKVRVSEDRYGPVYAGALVAGLDGARLEEFEESDTSGDWRRIMGNLELVAALCVNVGGFPKVGLSLAASGEPLALVASARSWGRQDEPSGTLDYDTLAAAIASRLRASDVDERERAALADELADDDSDEERLAALAGLDEGEEFTALAAFVSEHADTDDASFASLMPPQLQRSYLAGKVAARIVWGTPGDFRRCVVQAKAHGMGRKAQGACNYLHNKAVGFYPGDRRNK